MSMLAERKQKQRWSLNPRGKQWSEDSSKFGQKMLEKMGWKHGKGLGANEDGITENVKLNYKNDQKGMGYKEIEQWTEHEDNFTQLLNNLNGDSTQNDEIKVSSLHEKAENVKTRINYHKFTKGKDLSRYSEKDLANIFGRKNLKKIKKMEREEKEENEKKEIKVVEEEKNEILINKGSLIDYFKKKLPQFGKFGYSGIKIGNNGVLTKELSNLSKESDTESEKCFGFGFKSAETDCESNKSKRKRDLDEDDQDFNNLECEGKNRKVKKSKRSKEIEFNYENGLDDGNTLNDESLNKDIKSGEVNKQDLRELKGESENWKVKKSNRKEKKENFNSEGIVNDEKSNDESFNEDIKLEEVNKEDLKELQAEGENRKLKKAIRKKEKDDFDHEDSFNDEIKLNNDSLSKNIKFREVYKKDFVKIESENNNRKLKKSNRKKEKENFTSEDTVNDENSNDESFNEDIKSEEVNKEDLKELHGEGKNRKLKKSKQKKEIEDFNQNDTLNDENSLNDDRLNEEIKSRGVNKKDFVKIQSENNNRKLKKSNRKKEKVNFTSEDTVNDENSNDESFNEDIKSEEVNKEDLKELQGEGKNRKLKKSKRDKEIEDFNQSDTLNDENTLNDDRLNEEIKSRGVNKKDFVKIESENNNRKHKKSNRKKEKENFTSEDTVNDEKSNDESFNEDMKSKEVNKEDLKELQSESKDRKLKKTNRKKEKDDFDHKDSLNDENNLNNDSLNKNIKSKEVFKEDFVKIQSENNNRKLKKSNRKKEKENFNSEGTVNDENSNDESLNEDIKSEQVNKEDLKELQSESKDRKLKKTNRKKEKDDFDHKDSLNDENNLNNDSLNKNIKSKEVFKEDFVKIQSENNNRKLKKSNRKKEKENFNSEDTVIDENSNDESYNKGIKLGEVKKEDLKELQVEGKNRKLKKTNRKNEKDDFNHEDSLNDENNLNNDSLSKEIKSREVYKKDFVEIESENNNRKLKKSNRKKENENFNSEDTVNDGNSNDESFNENIKSEEVNKEDLKEVQAEGKNRKLKKTNRKKEKVKLNQKDTLNDENTSNDDSFNKDIKSKEINKDDLVKIESENSNRKHKKSKRDKNQEEIKHNLKSKDVSFITFITKRKLTQDEEENTKESLEEPPKKKKKSKNKEDGLSGIINPGFDPNQNNDSSNKFNLKSIEVLRPKRSKVVIEYENESLTNKKPKENGIVNPSFEDLPLKEEIKNTIIESNSVQNGIDNPSLNITDSDLMLNVVTTPILKSERSIGRIKKNVRFSNRNEERIIPNYVQERNELFDINTEVVEESIKEELKNRKESDDEYTNEKLINNGFVNNGFDIRAIDKLSFFESGIDNPCFQPKKLEDKVRFRVESFEAKLDNDINEYKSSYNQVWVGCNGPPIDKHTTVPEGVRLSFKNVKFGRNPPWMSRVDAGPKKSYKHLIKGDIIVAFKSANLHEIAGYGMEVEEDV